MYSPRPILESLTLEMRFEKPSAIQASSLPLIFQGKNIIAQAQSGAGKTIAFAIGMLTACDTRLNYCQALCLTPTREIAIQIVEDAVKPLSSRIPSIRYEIGIPGRTDVDTSESVSASQLIVGTPGTIKRWIKEGYLPTKGIFILFFVA
jgi:superfamily II DNA/RNA helicase